jgi:hypothetical protein
MASGSKPMCKLIRIKMLKRSWLSWMIGNGSRAARALHERLFRATITMQGETRVPIAIGMRRAIDVCWRFRLIIRGGKHP